MFKHIVLPFLAMLAISACSGDKTATAAAQSAAAPAAKPAAATAPASAREWRLGTDYFLIDPRVPTTTGDKIEVVEVFSYACPHCAHFLPTMEELKSRLPANAQLVLLPAIFNQQWEPFARAFYAARSLGVLDKTHAALFEALHGQHRPLYSIEALANDFYANYGVDPKSFLGTANSFVIDNQMANGDNLVRSYNIHSTPTLIVNGKYRIELNTELRIGPQDVLDIALMLVKQESAQAKP
jgi:thiol:disulfide interchange protein DsbA